MDKENKENKNTGDKYIEAIVNMMNSMTEKDKKRIYKLTRYIFNNKERI